MAEAATDSAAEPTPRACAALAVVAMLLRLALAMRSVTYVDRLFVPDDTYYTLSIARSLARGLGPTVDGQHLTNGFQPLLAFLLAPLLRFVEEPDSALRCALVIGAVADGVTTWLVGHLSFRIGANEARRQRRLAALFASGAWAVSGAAIATAMNGLETSLAVACTLGALAAWVYARRHDGARAWLGAGALLGLCLLARVDTCFFVAIALLATLARAGIRPAALSAAGAAAVVSPWWAYCRATFGTIVPESGNAVREQALRYKAMGLLVVRDQLAWAAAAVTGPPFLDSAWLRHAIGRGAPVIGCALCVAFVVLALAVARQPRRPDALRILALSTSCLIVFYGLYLPATWFFRRYLAPTHAFVDILGAAAVAHAWERRDRVRHRVGFWAIRLGAAVGLLTALGGILRFSTSTPAVTPDQGHHGAKGYREPALQILAVAPPGAVIGAFQSGALGWFADRTTHAVVNLDGVVDREAAEAVRARRLAAFARSRHVTHLADWDVNIQLFLERAGDRALGRASLHEVGRAESQGAPDRFVLYELDTGSKGEGESESESESEK